jgi:hypothetical protein
MNTELDIRIGKYVLNFLMVVITVVGLWLAMMIVWHWYSELNAAASPITPRAAAPADPRVWRTLPRKPLLTDSFDVVGSKAWTLTNQNSSPERFRCTVRGEFSASAPIWFVAVDAANWQRWNSGSPPLVQYQQENPGDGITPSQVATACPDNGGAYVFLPQPPARRGIPTSGVGLALALLASFQQAHQPPVRVTANLWAEEECFCTSAEAGQ